MKRAIVLAIFAMLLMITAASADTAYITVNAGYNLISAPLVPYNPAPSAVFRDTNNAALTINGGRLQKFDTPSGGYLNYTPSSQTWGGILLGTGYFLRNDTGSAITVEYLGVPNGVPDVNNNKTDMWISLPTAGYNMIGNPFNNNISWPSCLMTDGSTTVSIPTAKTTNLWWTGSLQYFNNSTGGFLNISVSPTSSSRYMKPNMGYYLTTLKANLALIIPATATT
jgi:hypothetical protein